MKKILSLFSLGACIAIFLNSCTGPAGSDGPQGPPAGNGVTNMSFYSFTLDTISWVLQGGADSTGFNSVSISIATLVKQAQPDAQLVVYYSLSSLHGPWNALPYSGIFYGNVGGNNDTIIDQLGYQFSFQNPGDLIINYNYLVTRYHFKVHKPKVPIYGLAILIPQVVMKRHPNTNWKNCNAVLQMPEAKAAFSAENH